jgi:hypothetical protein
MQYALNSNIPVIQVAWIDECWQHVHISSATPADQLKYLVQVKIIEYQYTYNMKLFHLCCLVGKFQVRH